jgi:hypothetical protein
MARLVDQNDRIHFWYGPDRLDYFEVYLGADDILRVRTPQASLAVRPYSSNVVQIEAADRT